MIGSGIIGCDECENPIEGEPFFLMIPNEGTQSATRWEFCGWGCLGNWVGDRAKVEVAAAEVNATGGCSECSAPWEPHRDVIDGVCGVCKVNVEDVPSGHCTNYRCPETGGGIVSRTLPDGTEVVRRASCVCDDHECRCEPAENRDAAVLALMTKKGYTVAGTGGGMEAWARSFAGHFAWISSDLCTYGDPHAAEWGALLWEDDEEDGEPAAVSGDLMTLQGAIRWVEMHEERLKAVERHDTEEHMKREIPADTDCHICVQVLAEELL